MAKRDASVKNSYNFLNIKLRMPEAKEASVDDYTTLLTTLSNRKIQVLVNPNIGVIMKRCLIERIGNEPVLYGIITRYTPVITGKLLNLDNPDQEEEDQDGLPKNRVPNPKDVAFFFSPTHHRLALSKKGAALSITQAQTYFDKAFKQIIKTGQLVDVDVEQDEDAIHEILEAPKLKRVRVVVTYSNNDMSLDNAAEVDRTMKSANMQQLIMEAVADGSPEGLDVNRIPFLQGAIQLAQSNGTVSATVIDAKSPGKRGRKVVTEEHPREESVVSEKSGDVLRDAYLKIKSLFPRG